MIKFLLRIIGIGRYKVFLALSDTCWRQRGRRTFVKFSSACAMADKCASEDNILGGDFTVAFGRDEDELYRAKVNKVKK